MPSQIIALSPHVMWNLRSPPNFVQTGHLMPANESWLARRNTKPARRASIHNKYFKHENFVASSSHKIFYKTRTSRKRTWRHTMRLRRTCCRSNPTGGGHGANRRMTRRRWHGSRCPRTPGRERGPGCSGRTPGCRGWQPSFRRGWYAFSVKASGGIHQSDAQEEVNRLSFFFKQGVVLWSQ